MNLPPSLRARTLSATLYPVSVPGRCPVGTVIPPFMGHSLSFLEGGLHTNICIPRYICIVCSVIVPVYLKDF